MRCVSARILKFAESRFDVDGVAGDAMIGAAALMPTATPGEGRWEVAKRP